MKKIVISLRKRTDRKQEFQKNKLQNFEYIEAVDGDNFVFRNFRAREGWVDPFKNRPLLQNEVACFISHYNAWQRVLETQQPCIIMEDDAIINEHWNEEYFESLVEDWDFVYLQRNENEPTLVSPVEKDPKLEIPYYPYNLTAYLIKPETAAFLVGQFDQRDMIPVDEWIPQFIRSTPLRFAALKQDACNQLPRSMGDIENARPFRHYQVHAVTCGTDRKKCEKLMTSARHHGVNVINIGTNVDWKGTDMSAMGGGMKINLMREWIKTINPHDVVLFTDAYDVFYADDIETIHERYLEMDSSIIFSGELYCYPDPSLADKFPEGPTRFRYINSGTYIGKAMDLRILLSAEDIADDGDDQLYMHKAFLSGKYNISIDYECYIFQTNFDGAQKLGHQLHNPETKCCPCIYHGNGGESAKPKFDDLYQQFFPKTDSLWIKHKGKVKQLRDDLLMVEFMTQEQCERLIEIADAHGGWGSLEYDKFPAQEIRLSELKLFDDLNRHWQENIVPIVENYWKPLQMYGLRDAFVMRYAMDTQTDLKLHHDAALVTGSVKLNDDYEGAELIYPRQTFSNKDVPVGNMILFPSAVTHGHECLPLTKGTKYSLTIWSCRYVGDTI